MFEKLQDNLEKYVSPLAGKLNNSNLITAMTRGLMYTMPVILGVSLLAILVYLPIEGWQNLLTNTNLGPVTNELLSVTMNSLAIYMVVAISYSYGKLKNHNGIVVAVISLAVFLSLIPLNVLVEDRATMYSIDTSYLGSEGIFIAITLSLIVSGLYVWLKDRISIKLPESVPPMVSDSLSPTFVAIIIFTLTFIVKWLLTFTTFGDIFTLINTVLAAPLTNIGTSPLAIILAYSFSAFLWFFGVHPSAIMNVFSPFISVALLGNLEAFMAGTPANELPYLTFVTIYMCMSIGGSGQLFGLSLNMIRAKSERFKSMFKLTFIPNLFNISEPVMFGVPVVMNPVFFLPMVLATPLTGFLAWGLTNFGLNNAMNPAVISPWVLPKFIAGFLTGGIGLMIIVLICMILSFLLYYPFFNMADKQALEEEQAQTQE